VSNGRLWVAVVLLSLGQFTAGQASPSKTDVEKRVIRFLAK
jgi:hypothetical protein